MKKTKFVLFLLFVFPLFVHAQTLDDKLKEIDAYATTVMTTWKDSAVGMAIAIVKDDKVVMQKGYGMKVLVSSPSASYAHLFQAVKAKNTEEIKRWMSKKTLDFGVMAAVRNNTQIEKVYENGFTATTFSNSIPQMRDERIADKFGAVEVFNEQTEKDKEMAKIGGSYGSATIDNTGRILSKASEDARQAILNQNSWEDLPFVLEDGEWKLAIGELFAGTFQSPGKSFSWIERERNTNTAPTSLPRGTRKPKKTKVVPELQPLPTPQLIESPFVDENTLFAIASNSKAFTTASLAILVDEKKLNWDDKVSKYLPDFQLYDPWVTSELTVRDLVTHRVGLDTFSGDLLWYDTTYTADEMLRRVRYLKPVSSFRTRFGYQNLMFIAAGKVVEKVSGKLWADFIRERILTPLGMNRTTLSVRDLKDNYAMPHNESGGKLRALPLGFLDNASGAVRLNSSVADLSKWIRLQLGRGKFEGKQIFSEAQSWQMHQQYLARPISEAASRNNPTQHFSGVGMGWFVYDYYGKKIINHSGGLDGMLSYTVLIPEENAGFVVLTNNESPSFQIMMAKIRDVFVNAPKRDWNAEAVKQVAAGKTSADEEMKKVDAARIPNTQASLALADYAGTYTSQMYGDVTIAEENGKLVMRMLPAPNFVADLEHWHLDTFQIHWRPSVNYNFPRGFVTFTIDKNGKTDQLKIDQPNNDFWFYELELKRSGPVASAR